jgi:hypothetical protein
MADRTMFGWRRVARILASDREREILKALGIPRPTRGTQAWARDLLDSVDDFYEVWDVEPDGGRAARSLERELGDLAGPSAMAGLVEAAKVLSRPLSDSEPLGFWGMLFDLVLRDERMRVDLPAGLAARVRAVLESQGWPASPQIEMRSSGPIEDEWEAEFSVEHDELEPGLFANEVVDIPRTERTLLALFEALGEDDRAALERWANAEAEARAGGPRSPSPGIVWPSLALPMKEETDGP